MERTGDRRGIPRRRRRLSMPGILRTLVALCIYSTDVLVEGKGEVEYLAVFLPQESDGGSNVLEIAASGDTVVSIEVPYLNIMERYTARAGQVKTFRYSPKLRTKLQEFHSNKTIHVRASRELTVRGLNLLASSADSFLALPIDEDSTHFRAISYTQTDVFRKCMLTVASLLGRNRVNIASTRRSYFRYRDRLYRDGETLFVTLERLQTVQVESYDVTGLLVTSHSPVAVYSGCNCVYVPRFFADCDHIVEQVPPLASWGKEFVSGAVAGRKSGEIFRVLSSCNATQVQVNGKGYGVVDEGEFLEFKSIALSPSRIDCSNPCLVALFIQGYSVDNRPGDPAMVIVPHTGQWVARRSLSLSSSRAEHSFNKMKHYVMLMTDSEHTIGTLLDGKALGFGRYWKRIPSTNYSVTVFQQALGTHRIRHTNSNVKFGVILYGLGAGVSYAHPGNVNLKTNPDRGCKLSVPLGPSNIRGPAVPEAEVQTYTHIPIVISLACLCLVLVVVNVVIVCIALRLRRTNRRMEQQKKIIIVPRASRPVNQSLPRTGVTNLSTIESTYNSTRNPISPPPYIEILDDP